MRYYVLRLIGSVILSRKLFKDLESLLAAKNLDGRIWTLLYRGSRDGFRSSDFHAKCNHKAKTLTIMKDTSGKIFGGYTFSQWNCGARFEGDPNAFIFSLANSLYKKIVFNTNHNYGQAIYWHSRHGPTFGGGYDLYISDNCNQNTDSTTCLGNTYANPEMAVSSTFLTGSKNFKVKEIEVFQKQ